VKPPHVNIVLVVIISLLGIVLLSAFWMRSQAKDYSASAATLGKPDVLQRFEQRTSRPVAATTLSSLKKFLCLVGFIKFDRKQNTRLWPFIFAGITRSPPLFQ
jgi:hypothetical protein